MQKETWKPVKRFEHLYEISSLGRLRSYHKKKNGDVLSVKNSKGWYLCTRLSNRQKSKTARIHRLVAEAFITNPNDLPEVNHINGNKQDNRIENLEWVSASENVRHAIKTNPKMLTGLFFHNVIERAKPVIQLTMSGEYVKKYPSAQFAGRITGICSRNIHQVCSKTEFSPGRCRKQAGGFRWEFAEGGDEYNAH